MVAECKKAWLKGMGRKTKEAAKTPQSTVGGWGCSCGQLCFDSSLFLFVFSTYHQGPLIYSGTMGYTRGLGATQSPAHTQPSFTPHGRELPYSPSEVANFSAGFLETQQVQTERQRRAEEEERRAKVSASTEAQLRSSRLAGFNALRHGH